MLDARQTTPRARASSSVGAPWEVCSPSRRVPVPTPTDVSSEILHRLEIPMSVRSNSAKAHETFYGVSGEKQHAAEQRRVQLLSARQGNAAGRVLQYASDPMSYQSGARAASKTALDSQSAQRQAGQQREAQRNSAADQMVLQHARMQEQQIQKQQATRAELMREAAAYNLRAVQEQQAARQQQRTAERAQAQAHEERSFYDRFGTSLA